MGFYSFVMKRESKNHREEKIIDDCITTGQSTRIMMRQIGKLPLDRASERKLATRARAGDKESRNRLAVSLLHRAVSQAARKYHGLDFDDRVQEGALALLEGVAETHPSHLDLPIRRRITKNVALMYRPFSIPYHLISVLGSLGEIWEEKAQELKRLPTEEELVVDLEEKIKRRGNFSVRENIHRWTKLLDLPMSLGEIENIVPAPMNVRDKSVVIEQIQEVLRRGGSRQDFQAAKLTLGIVDGKNLSQEAAARVLGVSQRTVSTRVNHYKRYLFKDSRIYALYKELRDLEEDFY